MIPPTYAKWANRVFVSLALLLFASTFAYLMTRNGPTVVGPDGEEATSLSTTEGHTAILLFCSTGWSICAAIAVRALASSSTAARAFLRILQPVGLGALFATPFPAISGNVGLSVALAVSGIALVGLSKLLYFAFFGAKETVERVQDGIEELRDQFAHRSDASAPRAAPVTFMPEASTGEVPPPVNEPQPPPAWSPPPPSYTHPPPPPVVPPPGEGSSWQ
jgi:hypothetical protein